MGTINIDLFTPLFSWDRTLWDSARDGSCTRSAQPTTTSAVMIRSAVCRVGSVFSPTTRIFRGPLKRPSSTASAKSGSSGSGSGSGGSGSGSSGSSSSSGNWYQRKLETHPYTTKSLTAAGVVACGDLICQKAIDNVESIDWMRAGRMALIGLVVVG